MPPKANGKDKVGCDKPPALMRGPLQMKQFEKATKRKRQAESPESGNSLHSQKTGLTGTEMLGLTDNRTRTGAGKMSQLPQEQSPSSTESSDKLTTPKAHALELLATVATTSHTSLFCKSASSDSESVITLGFKPRRTDCTFASYCTHKTVPSASSVNSENAPAEVEVVDLISISGSELSTQTLEDEVGQDEENEGEDSEKEGNEEDEVGVVVVEEVLDADIARYVKNLPRSSTADTRTSGSGGTIGSSGSSGGSGSGGGGNSNSSSNSQEDALSLELPRLQECTRPIKAMCTNATAITAAIVNNNPSMTASTTTTTSNTASNTTNTIFNPITNTTQYTKPTTAPTITPTTSNTTHTDDAEHKRTTDIAHLERILANKEVRDQLTMQQQNSLKGRLVELLLRNA